MRDSRGSGSQREGMWGGSWWIRGRGNHNQDIFCENRTYSHLKGKKKEVEKSEILFREISLGKLINVLFEIVRFSLHL